MKSKVKIITRPQDSLTSLNISPGLSYFLPVTQIFASRRLPLSQAALLFRTPSTIENIPTHRRRPNDCNLTQVFFTDLYHECYLGPILAFTSSVLPSSTTANFYNKLLQHDETRESRPVLRSPPSSFDKFHREFSVMQADFGR